MIPYSFSDCDIQEIREFVITNHYSHNVNGLKISRCFKITEGSVLVGAAICGEMSTTAWKKFGKSEKEVIELRRLVLIDETPRNTESWFISRIIKSLKKSSYKILVSYADPNVGHTGVIYKASNFKFVGMSGKDYGYRDLESGKVYHSRALRTKYKGEYKPFVKVLRNKLILGQLEKITLLPKYCFTYNLK